MRANGVVSRRIAGEVVLVPTQIPRSDAASFYVLNDSGELLWQRLTEPRTADELAEALVEHYSVAPEDAARDVDRFLRELQDCGAVAAQPLAEGQ